MKYEEPKIELFSENSNLNNSLIQVADNLAKITTQYFEIPEFALSSFKPEIAIPSFEKFQSQFINVAKAFESINYPQLSDQHFLAWQQLNKIQTLPFKVIGTRLGANPLDINFKAFDLSEIEFKEEKIKEDVIITESSRIKEIIQQIYLDKQFLYKLKSRKFEEVIAEILYQKGFEVQLTKQTRDNGYDILALKKIESFPVKFLVECKKFAPNRPIGIGIIRSFCNVIKEEKANKGIICTTSYFSQPSKDRKEKEGVILDFRDNSDILIWVKEYLGIEK